jgi:threonine synthase
VKYISTRDQAPVLEFDEVLLAGLARDGGLYVPETWPKWTGDDLASITGMTYQDIAVKVMKPFLGGCISDDKFRSLVDKAYTRFDDPDVAPLTKIGDNHLMMELFHGPTLSFKDYALQLVGLLFDTILNQRGEKVTIVGATSGDTGSAAIAACSDSDAIEIFILHPKEKVSEVQRRQMTTVLSGNVHNIAIDGTFDDCQNLVKAMFNDAGFRDRINLSAVNSINWARIMAQIPYYFWAWSRLDAGSNAPVFAVPTGNFGNVFAAYAAHQMGLPVKKLSVGSNSNDILTRFFECGSMKSGTVNPTISPSMDIQISSNFERFLFDLYGRDGARVREAMDLFSKIGEFTVQDSELQSARKLFSALRLDDTETKSLIGKLYAETGTLVDPHSAIGVAAGQPHTDGPVISVATAHPAKFPDAVEEASGVRPGLPDHISDLMEREEQYDTLANDLGTAQEYVLKILGERTAS